MIEICLIGAGGRMGRMITAAIADSKDCHLAAAVESAGQELLGQDQGQLAGIGPLGVKLSADLEAGLAAARVAIDFSLPQGLADRAAACAARGVALVTGITGLEEAQQRSLREAAAKVPVIWAPNMSVGVNLMFKVAAEVAKVLCEGWDVEIIETHHRFKQDAPSGTARKLAEVIAEAQGRELEREAVYGRQGITGERKPGQIGILAVRAGDVVGEHTVIFGALGERFELTHRAHSRDTFARGAVVAARFAAGAGPGLYDMQDVLGLKG